jgi:hypothetical protein
MTLMQQLVQPSVQLIASAAVAGGLVARNWKIDDIERLSSALKFAGKTIKRIEYPNGNTIS